MSMTEAAQSRTDCPRCRGAGQISGTPGSFGWLRRPEHDQAGGVAWERPGGGVVLLQVKCDEIARLCPDCEGRL